MNVEQAIATQKEDEGKWLRTRKIDQFNDCNERLVVAGRKEGDGEVVTNKKNQLVQ